MIEQRIVKIKKGSLIDEQRLEFTTTAPWELRLFHVSGEEMEFFCEGLDLFECLKKLRNDYLEKKGWFVLCNGSRIDVYPSRMSRQMSGGQKAYKMRLGKPADRLDLVDIFDPSEETQDIGTVIEQELFMKKWVKSLD